MIEQFFEMLAQGDYAGFADLFAGTPRVDDPIEGHVEGAEAAEQYARTKAGWLIDRGANVQQVRTTQGTERVVSEVVLNLALRERLVALPVALVGDIAAHGLLGVVRIYHSMWPLTGSHEVRPSLLAEEPKLKAPDVIADYQKALAKGDLEKILELFEPDGYAQEPSGGQYVHRGKKALREFYSSLFTEGGIPLQHCTMTDDGVCCAIEYNVVKLGRKKVTPQAGVAVYQRGPGSHLAAARIYDDVAVEEVEGEK